MDIVLFGMQGSGKGTQGKILAEKYGLRPFDMGGQLRSMIESGTSLGAKIKGIVESGQLVQDDIIMEVVESFLSGVPKEQQILFDGIPRTMNQFEKLMALLKKHDRDAFALLIKLSEEEAVKRITQRRVCSSCKEIYPAFYKEEKCAQCGGELVTRQDDTNLDSIKNRLENYEKETKPVIEAFYHKDHLIEVDGEQGIADVTEEMVDKASYLFS